MALDLDKLLDDNTDKIEKETSTDKDLILSGSDKDTVGSKETVGSKTKRGGAKKPKGKPRGGNSPVIGMNGYNLEPGDNAKYLTLNMELFNLPNIDLKKVEEVEERLNDYFAIYGKYDTKPTVSGMAVALNGHSRQWLWSVVTGNPYTGKGNKVEDLPPEVTNCIKKAYNLLEMLWENYMQNGKVNPVAGIFLGKNNYGYQDKTEYVLTPNQQNDSDYDADEIRDRYIAADQQKRLSDNSTSSETESD